MKRLLLLIVILSLLVVAGTIASAEGQTLHRSSVVGGKRATAIGTPSGATGSYLYSRSRRARRRH